MFKMHDIGNRIYKEQKYLNNKVGNIKIKLQMTIEIMVTNASSTKMTEDRPE